MKPRALLLALTASCAVLLFATPAFAQIHWDAGGEVGVAKRFLTRVSSNDSDAGFGPMIEVHGHVALLPLLRVGGYVMHEISPISGASAYQITAFGVRGKFTPPLLRDPWRSWAFAGFGYAGVYGPSYHTVAPTAPPTNVLVDGAGGGYFEIPVGIGVGYRVRQPLELTAELGGRLGFAFSGSLYRDDTGAMQRPAEAPGLPPGTVDAPSDTWAVYLALGVSFEL